MDDAQREHAYETHCQDEDQDKIVWAAETAALYRKGLIAGGVTELEARELTSQFAQMFWISFFGLVRDA